MKRYLGLDIGGANIKIASLTITGKEKKWETDCIPVNAGRFVSELNRLLFICSGDKTYDAVIATQTACLLYDDIHRGTIEILHSVANHTAHSEVSVTVDNRGNICRLDKVIKNPEQFVCSNIAVTASLAAKYYPDTLLMDMGTTSTDILTITNASFTNFDLQTRLLNRETIYLGAVRTPLQAIVSCLPYQGQMFPIVAEPIAAIADALLITHDISAEQYSMPTWDGGTKDHTGCAIRLAKLIANNTGHLSKQSIDLMAQYIRQHLIHKIISSVFTVASKNPQVMKQALYTGTGSSILAAACALLNISSTKLETALSLPPHISYTPAVGACLLYELTKGDNE